MNVREQYEQLHADKFESVDGMNKFLKTYLYKLTQVK